jgi:hypothetical protein
LTFSRFSRRFAAQWLDRLRGYDRLYRVCTCQKLTVKKAEKKKKKKKKRQGFVLRGIDSHYDGRVSSTEYDVRGVVLLVSYQDRPFQHCNTTLISCGVTMTRRRGMERKTSTLYLYRGRHTVVVASTVSTDARLCLGLLLSSSDIYDVDQWPMPTFSTHHPVKGSFTTPLHCSHPFGVPCSPLFFPLCLAKGRE